MTAPDGTNPPFGQISTGDNTQIYVHSGAGSIAAGGQVGPALTFGLPRTVLPDADALAQRRSDLLFGFYEQARAQATQTFRLAMIFMSLGAVILLVGSTLALFKSGEGQANSVAAMSALAGVVVTTCGGAFAVQAHRARLHVAEHAERMHEDMRSDRTLAHAVTLIETLQHGQERERITAIAALRALGVDPTSPELASEMLPQQHLPVLPPIPPPF
ncbi:TRADD-N-associated membrane domain-containing protein [Embleya sp. NPDC055664]